MPNPFPLNISNKVNSPELLAFFQQFGIESYLSAEEINKLRDGLNYLYENSGSIAPEINRLLTVGDIYRNPGTNTFVYNIGFSGYINELIVANVVAFNITPSEASPGKKRGDSVVLNADNDILLVEGDEDDTNYIFPQLPDDVLEVGRHFVFGDEISVPEPPAISNEFMRKQTQVFVANHVDDLASYMFTDERRHLVIGNDMEGVIQGLPANPDAVLSPRMFHSIHNKSAFPATIKNNGTGHFRYFFPYNQDYILAPGEIILFLSDGVVDRRFVFVSTNMPDKVVYISKASNFTFTNAFHGATVYVIMSLNATLPAGLRPDFTCNVKSFAGAICAYLTSGTTISSQSDGTVQAEKSMVHISANGTNTYILSGGGLSS